MAARTGGQQDQAVRPGLDCPLGMAYGCDIGEYQGAGVVQRTHHGGRRADTCNDDFRSVPQQDRQVVLHA